MVCTGSALVLRSWYYCTFAPLHLLLLFPNHLCKKILHKTFQYQPFFSLNDTFKHQLDLDLIRLDYKHIWKKIHFTSNLVRHFWIIKVFCTNMFQFLPSAVWLTWYFWIMIFVVHKYLTIICTNKFHQQANLIATKEGFADCLLLLLQCKGFSLKVNY